MLLQLRDNLHWCDCAGRALFLDLSADRYFCLSHNANKAFLRLAREGAIPEMPEQLSALLARGLLIDGGREGHIAPPPIVEVPACDFTDVGLQRIGAMQVLHAIISELRLSWSLRTKPLISVLRAACKPHGFHACPPSNVRRRTGRIVAASNAAALITRSHDRCLVRALWVYSQCRKNGVRAKLVLGVVDHPFAAHAWVQLGSEILVGGYEQARLYSPIFVLQ